jgi:hypothetical protein
MKNTDYKQSFFSKYRDIITFGVSMMGAFYWMNAEFKEVNRNIMQIDTELSVIKTVLIMKDIMPSKLAKKGE